MKGFPDVKIYANADINISSIAPETIEKDLFIPQPTVYRKGFLDRVRHVDDLFKQQGIDILNLYGGIDYISYDENGEATNWTIIPPVVEVNKFNFNNGKIDYGGLIGERLARVMQERGHILNPELQQMDYPGFNGEIFLQLVNDGSHRVHYGLEKGINQNLLFVRQITLGFPYYAAPKPYLMVHVEEERPLEGGKDKTHVLTEPGHKLLYRLFPSGGIFSGDVRHDKSLQTEEKKDTIMNNPGHFMK